MHPTYPAPELKLQLALPDGAPVADHLVIAFCDVCAAGPRVALGLESTAEYTVSRHAVHLGESSKQTALLEDPQDAAAPAPVQLVNVTPQGSQQPAVSYLCFNTAFRPPNTAHAVAASVAWLQKRQQTLQGTGKQAQPVMIAGAAWLASLKPKPSDVWVLPIHGAPVPSGLSAQARPMPPATRLHDPFLLTLTHCLYVTGIPALCVLVPGNKPSVAGGLTDSQDTVSALATALQQAGALPQGVCTAVKTARLTLLDPWYTGDHGNSDNRMYT